MTYKRKEVIGDCTLYLGDCLEVMPTLGKVDHVVCDPPYEDHVHKSSVKLAKNGSLRDKRNPFNEFDFQSIDNIRDKAIYCIERLCDGWFIAFCTIEGTAMWANALNQSSIKYKRPCLWIKPDGMPQFNGQCPGLGCEAFTVSWAGVGVSKWNGGGKHGIYTHSKGKDRFGGHPTEKPVALMSDIINDFTNQSQTILDPFMGSGTTGVACVKLGRKFIGIELDEKYFDIACKRIEEAYRQSDMFIEPPKKPVQGDLL